MIWPDLLGLEASPVVCLVNRKSGGGQGDEVLSSLRQLLSPPNVCDLSDPLGQPLEMLRQSAAHAADRLRIVVAGGDGTVCSVLAMLQQLKDAGELLFTPPVSVVPLGTGNDLARVFGWGGGWSGESLDGILAATKHAVASPLDRWCAEFAVLPQLVASPSPSVEASNALKNIDFCNYLGVGVDASIASGFDWLRSKLPCLCRSRFVNRAHYVWLGVVELLWRSSAHLGHAITLRCDGIEHALGDNVQGVILCNIASYGGGSELWEGASTSDPHQDGKLDVVAVRGPVHLGLVKLGLAHGSRLCQATVVEITSRRSLPVQADGEPWLQPPSRLTVTARATKASILERAGGVNGGERAPRESTGKRQD